MLRFTGPPATSFAKVRVPNTYAMVALSSVLDGIDASHLSTSFKKLLCYNTVVECLGEASVGTDELSLHEQALAAIRAAAGSALSSGAAVQWLRDRTGPTRHGRSLIILSGSPVPRLM